MLLWLNVCSNSFEVAESLTIWEFMFLLANAQDRSMIIKTKIPDARMKLEKDSNKLTYKLDNSLNHNRSPDLWLQKIYNSQIDAKRVHFTADRQREEKEEGKQDPKKRVKISQKPSSHFELRNLLRNPEMIKEIKETLKKANQILKNAAVHPDRNADVGLSSCKDLPLTTKRYKDRTLLKNGDSQKQLKNVQSDDNFGRELCMPPGTWTQVKHSNRPMTARTSKTPDRGQLRSAMNSNRAPLRSTKTPERLRPKTAETELFHLTSGVTHQSLNFSTRPKTDRPLTAGTHRSTTRTAVTSTQLELVIKTEAYKPMTLRQATVLGLMQSCSKL